MKVLRKDRTAKKEYLQLEDWTEHKITHPYVVSVAVFVTPTRGKRVAFGFDTQPEADAAFEALMLGTVPLSRYRARLTDRACERYI